MMNLNSNLLQRAIQKSIMTNGRGAPSVSQTQVASSNYKPAQTASSGNRGNMLSILGRTQSLGSTDGSTDRSNWDYGYGDHPEMVQHRNNIAELLAMTPGMTLDAVHKNYSNGYYHNSDDKDLKVVGGEKIENFINSHPDLFQTTEQIAKRLLRQDYANLRAERATPQAFNETYERMYGTPTFDAQNQPQAVQQVQVNQDVGNNLFDSSFEDRVKYYQQQQ